MIEFALARLRNGDLAEMARRSNVFDADAYDVDARRKTRSSRTPNQEGTMTHVVFPELELASLCQTPHVVIGHLDRSRRGRLRRGLIRAAELEQNHRPGQDHQEHRNPDLEASNGQAPAAALSFETRGLKATLHEGGMDAAPAAASFRSASSALILRSPPKAGVSKERAAAQDEGRVPARHRAELSMRTQGAFSGGPAVR